MLDFYLITDEQLKPNDPAEARLEPAGELDDKTFDRLKRKGLIDERFDYHGDFRWSRALVTQLQEKIATRGLQQDTDVQKLLRLLEPAAQKHSGLIAYAD